MRRQATGCFDGTAQSRTGRRRYGLSGVGGLYWTIAKNKMANVVPGGSLWTLALMAQ